MSVISIHLLILLYRLDFDVHFERIHQSASGSWLSSRFPFFLLLSRDSKKKNIVFLF